MKDFMTMSVGLDLQDSYDKAIAISKAWLAGARKIRDIQDKGQISLEGCEDSESIGDKLTWTVNTKQAYGDALVMGASWEAFANVIGRQGRVCTHPEGNLTKAGSVIMCNECGKVIDGAED